VAVFDKLDKPRKFTLDLQTVRIAENSLGVGIQRAAEEKIGPTFFITCLWAGLTKEDRNLSYRDVEKMVSKAIKNKKLTMWELQKYILKELGQSEAMSGYQQSDDEDDVPLAPSS
jgi:hypothetical protein